MRASAGDASAGDDASRRAGAAAMSRASPDSDAEPSLPTSPPRPPGARSSHAAPPPASSSSPHPRALPDEVVLRVFRHALADPGAWSVGGRFRPADAPPRRVHRPRAASSSSTTTTGGASASSRAAGTNASVARGTLRAVCSQWRRLLDQTCAHIEARRAVLFGDDALVGLARCVGGACERLTLEGNHLEGGRLALTARRGVLDALDAMPSLATLRIERTGMRLDDILDAATSNGEALRDLEIVGRAAEDAGDEEGGDSLSLCGDGDRLFVRGDHAEEGGASRRPRVFFKKRPGAKPAAAGPWESAMLHDVRPGGGGRERPGGSSEPPADDPTRLAPFLRARRRTLETLRIVGVPGYFSNAVVAASRAPSGSSASTGTRLGSGSSSSRHHPGLRGGALSSSRVFDALANCTALRVLELSDVGMDGACAAAIARSVPKTLEALALAGPGVGCVAGAAVARRLALDETPALRAVSLPRAALGAEAALNFDAAFERRRDAGRALHVRLRGGGLFRGGGGGGEGEGEEEAAEIEFALPRRRLRRWLVVEKKGRGKDPAESGAAASSLVSFSADAVGSRDEEGDEEEEEGEGGEEGEEEGDEANESASKDSASKPSASKHSAKSKPSAFERRAARRVANDATFHLAQREAFREGASADLPLRPSAWNAARLWSALGPGAPESAYAFAARWLSEDSEQSRGDDDGFADTDGDFFERAPPASASDSRAYYATHSDEMPESTDSEMMPESSADSSNSDADSDTLYAAALHVVATERFAPLALRLAEAARLGVALDALEDSEDEYSNDFERFEAASDEGVFGAKQNANAARGPLSGRSAASKGGSAAARGPLSGLGSSLPGDWAAFAATSRAVVAAAADLGVSPAGLSDASARAFASAALPLAVAEALRGVPAAIQDAALQATCAALVAADLFDRAPDSIPKGPFKRDHPGDYEGPFQRTGGGGNSSRSHVSSRASFPGAVFESRRVGESPPAAAGGVGVGSPFAAFAFARDRDRRGSPNPPLAAEYSPSPPPEHHASRNTTTARRSSARASLPHGARLDVQRLRSPSASLATRWALARWLEGRSAMAPPSPGVVLGSLDRWIRVDCFDDPREYHSAARRGFVCANQRALAARCAAAGVRIVAGHEANFGMAGPRSLAAILGLAARTQPSRSHFATESPTTSSVTALFTGSRPKHRPHYGPRRGAPFPQSVAPWDPPALHSAVRNLFSRRKFAPLLRTRRDADEIVSWPEWLRAVGAPAPADAVSAHSTSRALKLKAVQYERLEAEAASVAARMERLGEELRRLSRDAQLDAQYRREPARAIFKEAHDAMGWRVVVVPAGGGAAAAAAARGGVGRRRRLLKGPSPGWGRRAKAPLRRLFALAAEEAARRRVEEGDEVKFAEGPGRGGGGDEGGGGGGAGDEGGGVGSEEDPPGWLRVDDVRDTSRLFREAWEYTAAASMLAWFADDAVEEEEEGALRDVLRVLGARDDAGERGGVPVSATRGLRRRDGAEGVALDETLRRNLLLCDDEQ